MVKTKKELKNLRLSPSGINLFYQCPRQWYYRYVLDLKDEESIYLQRGSLVHHLIENVFKPVRYMNMKKYFKDNLPKKWVEHGLKKDTKDMKDFYKETELMLKLFAEKFEGKIKIACLAKRIKDKNHAWNTLRPKFRELNVESKIFNTRGIVDAVEKGYDGRVFLVDYKTSTLYRHQMSEDYMRQLRLYALMYHEMYERYPDYLVVNYLKYGENFIVPFKYDYVVTAKMEINFVKNNTKSALMEDYPCSDHKWCKSHKKEWGINGENIPSHILKYAMGESSEA